MSKKRRILILGLGKKKLPFEDYELYLETLEKCPDFNEFDFTILVSGSFYLEHRYDSLGLDYGLTEDGRKKRDEMLRREKEIFNALDDGKIVSFLVSHVNDELIQRILRANKTSHFAPWREEFRTDIDIKRSEFTNFLKNFGTARIAFSENVDDVICTVENIIVGFAQKIRNGSLIFLPCHIPSFVDEKLMNLLQTLSESLISYSIEARYEPPSWVNEFEFPDEIKIRREIESYLKKMDELKEPLEKYSRLKTILWTRGNRLANEVRAFLGEMGFQTREDEDFEEDFWILEDDNEQIILEVKSKGRNLQRPDISKLDEHRGAKGKPDDFPALLVVNSFMTANSLGEKDIDISPNEIKKAGRTYVLLMRTLDLCNTYVLIEKGKMDYETLIDLMKTETGWLKVSNDTYEILKE